MLYYLQEHETATTRELAQQVVAWETGRAPEDVSLEHHESTVASLHHNHLPVLADAMLIEYDRRSETIRYSLPPASLDAFLRLTADVESEDSPSDWIRPQ